MAKFRLYMCHGPQCRQHNLAALRDTLQAELALLGEDVCEVVVSGCLGRCECGPNINIYPRLTQYCRLTPERMRKVVHEHIAKNQPVEQFLYGGHRY